MNRPPIDPERAYTVLSQGAARRHLTSAYRIPRHETANMTLDQLHDLITERTPEELSGDFIIITDRAFEKNARHSDALLKRYHGLPIEEGAGLTSMTMARHFIMEAGVEIPEGEDRDSLEDVLSAIKQSRYMILEDADFAAYGAEMTRLLSDIPSGRAKMQSVDA